MQALHVYPKARSRPVPRQFGHTLPVGSLCGISSSPRVATSLVGGVDYSDCATAPLPLRSELRGPVPSTSHHPTSAPLRWRRGRHTKRRRLCLSTVAPRGAVRRCGAAPVHAFPRPSVCGCDRRIRRARPKCTSIGRPAVRADRTKPHREGGRGSLARRRVGSGNSRARETRGLAWATTVSAACRSRRDSAPQTTNEAVTKWEARFSYRESSAMASGSSTGTS